LDFIPHRAGGLAVTAEATVGVIRAVGVNSWVAALVVSTCLDGGGAEDVVQAVALGVLVDPFLDGVEHVAVDLEVLVACGGVVEDVEDVVDYLVDGDAGVFPGVEDAARDGGLVDVVIEKGLVTYGAAY
jgi:hypothetical protein